MADLQRLLKAKKLTLDDLFKPDQELTRSDFLNAHARLMFVEQKGMLACACTHKHACIISCIPACALFKGKESSSARTLEPQLPSALSKTRLRRPKSPSKQLNDDTVPESPMEALISASSPHPIDRGISPKFFNPLRQDQMQTLYDYYKTDRGSARIKRYVSRVRVHR